MDRLRRPRSLPVAPADPWAQGRRGHRGPERVRRWFHGATRCVGEAGTAATGWVCSPSLWRAVSPGSASAAAASHVPPARKRAPHRGPAIGGGRGAGPVRSRPSRPPLPRPAPRALPEQPPRVQMELKSCHWTASLKKLVSAHHQTVAATCAVFCKEMGECASGGRRLSSSGPGSAFWQIPG